MSGGAVKRQPRIVMWLDSPLRHQMEAPVVNAYSLESSIAEKLEAIIHNGYFNSRYKDFYDIYVLTQKYDFKYSDMKTAVKETFENRKTEMSLNTAAFTDEFLNDNLHQTRWKGFLKKKKALIQVSMTDVFSWIKVFAKPLLSDLSTELSTWDHINGIWK